MNETEEKTEVQKLIERQLDHFFMLLNPMIEEGDKEVIKQRILEMELDILMSYGMNKERAKEMVNTRRWQWQ